MMKRLTLIAACLLPVACGTNYVEPEREAVVDYIAAAGLQEVDRIRTDASDTWTIVNDTFVIYQTRRKYYLIEFRRKCHELKDNIEIVADVRNDQRNLRARFDTIRGCMIDRMYAISLDQRTELRNLGDAPGEPN